MSIAVYQVYLIARKPPSLTCGYYEPHFRFPDLPDTWIISGLHSRQDYFHLPVSLWFLTISPESSLIFSGSSVTNLLMSS